MDPSDEQTNEMLTARQAATITGVPRTTLLRHIQAGRFDGAERDDDGLTWRIPVSALHRAGLEIVSERDEVAAQRPALGWHVYRLYDANDELLYVGYSSNFARRLTEHARDKPWMSDVATVRVERYPTEQAARRAETEHIKYGDSVPRYNIAQNHPGRKNDPRRTNTARPSLIAKQAERIAELETEVRHLRRLYETAASVADLFMNELKWTRRHVPQPVSAATPSPEPRRRWFRR